MPLREEILSRTAKSGQFWSAPHVSHVNGLCPLKIAKNTTSMSGGLKLSQDNQADDRARMIHSAIQNEEFRNTHGIGDPIQAQWPVPARMARSFWIRRTPSNHPHGARQLTCKVRKNTLQEPASIVGSLSHPPSDTHGLLDKNGRAINGARVQGRGMPFTTEFPSRRDPPHPSGGSRDRRGGR